MCADTIDPSTASDRLQAVFDYHQATKHRFEAFASGPGRLDRATQPDPAPLNVHTMSQLFYDSLALSAWKRTGTAR